MQSTTENPTPVGQPSGLSVIAGSDLYVVVNDYNTGDLARKVNARITAGFKPLGGIGCTSDRDGLGNDHRQFYQAMIFCPNTLI